MTSATRTTATVSNLNDGTTYFFTVTAYNIYNNTLLESQPSNEVSYKTAPLGAHTLTVNSGSGSGKYTESTRVKVSAKAPAAGQEFDRWTGDWQILDNPFDSTTTALVAEIEFYRNGVKPTRTGYGTPGSYNSNGNTFEKALDGSVDTRFDGKCSKRSLCRH